jgi:hypothetical protein
LWNQPIEEELRRPFEPARETGKVPHSTLAAAPPSFKAKAKVAYQDFLTLWKDADPDIPILKQAKAEYAKLK